MSSAYICSRPAGAAPLKAVDSPIGMPFSRLTSALVASARAARAAANRCMTSARSAAVVRPQGPESRARLAALTATQVLIYSMPSP